MFGITEEKQEDILGCQVLGRRFESRNSKGRNGIVMYPVLDVTQLRL